jgi:hypothetical protein
MISLVAAAFSRGAGVTDDVADCAAAKIVDSYPPFCAGYDPQSCASLRPRRLHRCRAGLHARGRQ